MTTPAMKPKHTKLLRLRVWNIATAKWFVAYGYRVGRRFAVTVPLASDISGCKPRKPWGWAVTHLGSGGKVVIVKDRRVAEIVAMVFDVAPINWSKVRVKDNKLTPEGHTEFQKLRLLRDWYSSLEVSFD